MTLQELKAEVLKEFNEEYGHQHYRVCEGRKCRCRRVLSSWLSKTIDKVAKETFEAVKVEAEDPFSCTQDHDKIESLGYNLCVGEMQESYSNFINKKE